MQQTVYIADVLCVHYENSKVDMTDQKKNHLEEEYESSSFFCRTLGVITESMYVCYSNSLVCVVSL